MQEIRGEAPRINVVAFGARGIDTFDSAAFVLEAKAWRDARGGVLYFPPGRFRVGANVTLDGALELADGAVLVPDAGVTITYSGTGDLEDRQYFDTLAHSGSISFVGTDRKEIRAVWFGNESDPLVVAAAVTTAATAGLSVYAPGKALYPVLTGEVGVTDSGKDYGNIERHGASVTGTAAANRAALQNAILSMSALGGGVVTIPENTYVLGDPQGAYQVFARPRSNVCIVGGPNSVLKAADGLNELPGFDGFSFIRHIKDDEGIPSVDNFRVEGVTFDHNGANNLIPSASPNKSNIAVGIEVGRNIHVRKSRFLNNSGLQTLSFGDNTSPQKVTRLWVVDNEFAEMGGSVQGNVASVDHSTIYAMADRFTIRDNVFANTNAGFKNTAVEVHGKRGTVVDNKIINYNHAFNIAATVTDQTNVKYARNIAIGVDSFATFYKEGAWVMRDVSLVDNDVEQVSGSQYDIMDFTSAVHASIQSVAIKDNTIRSDTPAGTAITISAIAVGPIKRLTLKGNKYRGIPGRCVTFNTLDADLRLTIVDEDALDCQTTTDGGFRQAFGLNNGVTTIALLRIARNTIANVAGSYTTYGFSGQIEALVFEITDNTMIGLPAGQDIFWFGTTHAPLIRHAGAGTPLAANVAAAPGSLWRNTSGGAGTTLYVKETGVTGAGWVAK